MKKIGSVLLFVGIIAQTILAAGFSNWQYYKSITVTPSGLSDVVTNFPLCIKLTAQDSTIFTQSQLGGYDIRFTASDGVTALPYQRAYWNTASKTAEFWVLVPSIATTTTTLKMYWGNSSAADTSQPSAVFATANGFRAVFHLNAASGVIDTDATTNHFLATPTGSPTDTLGGIGGLAKRFSGSSQYYTIANSANGALNFDIGGPYTLSAWSQITNSTPSGGAYIISKTVNQYALCFGSQYAGYVIEGLDELSNNTSERNMGDSAVYHVGAWHHYVFARSGLGSGTLYVDGVIKSSTIATYSGGTRATTSDVYLGSSTGSAGYFSGYMDEIRLDSGARSADWISLNYQTQMPGQTVVSLGNSHSTLIVPAVSLTRYVPSVMGHNGVLEIYTANGSRVMEIAYGATVSKTTLLNAASKTLAKGYYTYRFRSIDANVNIIGKLVK